jgi:drug/metabolite transporter (DMT)-like permease
VRPAGFFVFAMRQDRFAAGIALLLVTVLSWGGTFPVGKAAVAGIDPFWLAAIRYGVTVLAFAGILAAVEGRGAFDYEGRFAAAAVIGVIGFGGFNTLAFIGLQYSKAEHVALINALQAPITALALWAWRGVRPANVTLTCMAVAFAGVFLVATHGDPAAALAGGSLVGDLLALAAAVSWVVFSLGVVRFSGFSAIRYMTLTCIPGAAALFALAVVATALGAVVPDAATLRAHGWEVAYLIFFTSIVGVVCWIAGIQRVGPLNAALLANLVPIIAFAIGVALGTPFDAFEIGGAALVIGALVANNLLLRRRSAPT